MEKAKAGSFGLMTECRIDVHVAPDASSGVAREARNEDCCSETNVGTNDAAPRSLCSRGGRGVRPYTS